MKIKLLIAFLVLLTSSTFAQSDVEGMKEELMAEKELAVEINDNAGANSTDEDVASSKDKRMAFRETLKDLKRDLKDSYKATKSITKKKTKSSSKGGSSVPFVLLIILAILLPWLAVGLHTGWDLTLTLVSFLLWLLFVVPGIVFALLVIFDVIG